jgi:phosphoribosyl 1,2-cyclic phosphate phosphodiesterase
MAFELTVLGSGTSLGVPVIAREYPPAFLANPRNHRTRSSLLVATEAVRLVIDAGPDFRHQMLREQVRWLDAVFITHPHADHIMGLDDLRRFCTLLKGKIPLYGAPHTLLALRRIFAYAFDGPVPYGYFDPDPREFTETIVIGDLQITPLPLPHGRIQTTGLLFEQGSHLRLAYLNDCSEVPDAVIHRIRGIDCVFLDALRRDPHPTHMCLDEALTAARRIGAGQTWFTHLTDEYDHDRDDAELPPGVHFAYDGLRLNLP